MTVSEYVRAWLADERGYTIKKFGLPQDDDHILEGLAGWWAQQFDNYLHRAWVLGLDTPGGRQALAKFVATAVGALEAAVRVYGPLPEPGVSSGNNLDALRPLELDAGEQMRVVRGTAKARARLATEKDPS